MFFDCLVSAEELAAQLANTAWRIFDCRHDLKNAQYGRAAYLQGHIPGARFLHLDDDLSGPQNGSNGRHPLPDVVAFSRLLGACGVGADSQVVAYDDQGGMFAARLWWMLRWLGHEKVAVLNGGLTGWLRAGMPLETATPAVAPTQFSCQVRNSDMRVDVQHVLQNLHSSRMLLLDARAPDRYAGENETLDPVGGHIPGARNRFFARNLDAAGCFFKPAEALRIEFEELLEGHDPRTVIQQCGSGVTACHNLLAMEIAGLHGSKLYAGSWSEWCADPLRPFVTGGQPG